MGSPADPVGGALAPCRPRQERELLAQGWQARFVADLRRAQEAATTYAELGFEVKILPLEGTAATAGCAACALSAHGLCVIYTQRPGSGTTRPA